MAEVYMPIRAHPYEHQRRAFEFACGILGIENPRTAGGGVALLMQMGCGKSLVGVAIAGALYQIGLVSKVLIVAPLSVLGVWQEEFERFADFPYELTILNGGSAKKRETLRRVGQAEKGPLRIVVNNYESTWRLEKELLSFNADLIIADEGHKIKDGTTAQSKAMHHLGDHARFKLLLTGTLISNKEIDVYSQYRFCDSRVFGKSFIQFRNHFFEMGGYGGYTPIFRTYRQDEFLQKLHSIAFRVTKAECLDLPEITEEVRTVELEPSAMKIYRELEKQSFAELPEESTVSATNVLTKLLRLSQATGGFLTDDEGKKTRISTAKIDALSDIIDSVMEEDKKLVVMARFVAEMDEIEKLLQKKHIDYAVIRGGVKNRQQEVDKFQNDTNCHVFLGQIAAAGLGLTLTAASTMVFYSLDYSMSNHDQAKARIHRVSQKEDCHYIYLQAKGTVDSKVLKSLRDKADLASLLVDEYRQGKNPFSE
ncbi:MAG: DEAD/DEAH box helicase [Oscillospiraceae bacterium]|nr:DEAD/DEAH box helicase [Oscillospiraceae bacterium]